MSTNTKELSAEITSHANDWSFVQDKLSIENFDTASLPLSSWQELGVKYDQQRSAYQALRGELQALEKQHAEKENEIEKNNKQKDDAQRKIAELSKNLETDNTETIKKLQDEKKSLVAEQEQLKVELRLTERGFASVLELINHKNQLIQK